MKYTPDEIELDSTDDLKDDRVIEAMDYIVTGGDVYKIVVNDYGGELYLKRVDEIPEKYWDLYDQEVHDGC